MTTKDYPQWVHRYLERLGLTPEPPTHAFLEKISLAHLSVLAFENISKMIYYRDYAKNGFWIPPVETFVESLFDHDYGGVCYMANSHALRLLLALGYNAYHVSVGSVHHLAILVELPEYPGERMYVDYGSASPYFKPVRFETDPDNLSAFGVDELRLLPVEGQPGRYKTARYRRGELVNEDWTFHPDERKEFSDFADIIDEANKPGAFFMSQLRCQLWQPDLGRSVSLVNNILTIRTLDFQQEQRKLHTIEAIEQVIADEFRLPKMPVREAIAVLTDLGVDIFKEQEKEA